MSGPQFQSFYSLFGSCEISKLLIEYKAAAAAVRQDQIRQHTATAMDIQAIRLQAVKQIQIHLCSPCAQAAGPKMVHTG